MNEVYNTNLEELDLVKRGKVRDIYSLGEALLFVASDRISAFDVIMKEPIPSKGKILTQISVHWFGITREIIPNHFITCDVNEFPESCRNYRNILEDRSLLVKKTEPLPVEFVVRGYIAGSGWKEYKQSQKICGIEFPGGLQEYSKLPEPVFTPATKEESGHDINIDFDRAASILGNERAEYLRDKSIELYNFGAEYLWKRGIILADTKFEFGVYEDEIILIDEALTPDSSRFWLIEDYKAGGVQTNFDKQVLRDYLETLDWGKVYPPPSLPGEIINKTLDKYKSAYRMITGREFG